MWLTNYKNLFLGRYLDVQNLGILFNLTIAGFTGMITVAAAWAIWGSDMFPAEPDPTGGNKRPSISKYQCLS